MKHLKVAEDKYYDRIGCCPSKFYKRDGNVIEFTIQDGPIGEVGNNGLQVTDLLQYLIDVYRSLNSDFPCRENSLTITKLEEAIHWQDARTQDREKRGVEGFSKD